MICPNKGTPHRLAPMGRFLLIFRLYQRKTIKVNSYLKLPKLFYSKTHKKMKKYLFSKQMENIFQNYYNGK